MTRGEGEFLIGLILLAVGAVAGAQANSMIFPGTVVLCIIGLLFMLGAAFDTGKKA